LPPPFYFLSLHLTPPRTFHQWNLATYFGDWLISLKIMSSRINQVIVGFYSSLRLYSVPCVYRAHLIYLFTSDWLWLVPLWWIIWLWRWEWSLWNPGFNFLGV
jgi:hypothetical protein